MLAGRMRHGDNQGNSGLLVPGSVQWMTAGRGIVHSEMPEQEDGLMWGFQLWVNLPASEKMRAPRYQDIAPHEVPEVAAANGATLRVIAGRFGTSPALFVVTEDGELDPTEGGLKAGPGGTDVPVKGTYLYAPLSGATSHFYAIAKSADGKRVAATTNGHEDGALLAVLNLE
jgi:hypothetical protein